MEKIRRYVAYGSNLNLEQMKFRCPTAEVLGTAVLHGWALRFRGVATIERCKRSTVPVLVWSVQPQDEEALDRYEGWPRLYRKERIRLYLNGRQVSAFVYIMNEETRRYSPPHQSYYETIREGYDSSGFDIRILDRAVDESHKRTPSRFGFQKR